MGPIDTASNVLSDRTSLMTSQRTPGAHSPKPNPHHSTPYDFFEALYPEMPEGAFLLVWTPSDHPAPAPNTLTTPPTRHRAARAPRSFWFADTAGAADFVATTQDRELYFQVGLSGGDHGPHLRCSSNESDERPVIALPGLFADIDIADPTAHTRHNLPPDIAEARRIVYGHGLDPTMVVSSGYGLHCYWLFKELWEFADGAERGQAAALLLRFRAFLKGQAKALGYHMDSVQDMARVLRPIGGLNFKGVLAGTALTPAPVDLIHHNEALRYNPSDFEDFLPELPVVEGVCATPGGDKVQICVSTTSTTARPEERMPIQDELWFQALCELEPRFELSWRGKNPGLEDQSLSSYDLSLAGYAVNAGCSDQQVYDLILAFREKNGKEALEKALSRPKYVMDTIMKAKGGKAAREGSERGSGGSGVVIPLKKTESEGADMEPAEQVESMGAIEKAVLRERRIFTADRDTAELSESTGGAQGGGAGEISVAPETAPACAGEGPGGSPGESLESVKAEIKAAMAAHNKAAMTQLLQKTGLPTIVINGRQFRDVLEDTVAVVEGAKDLYLQAGHLVQMRVTEEGPTLCSHSEDSFRGILSNLANFVHETKEAIRSVTPPRDLMRTILSKTDLDLPEIRGFLEAPVFKKNGKMVKSRGYDRDIKKIYVPGPGLDEFKYPTKAKKEDAELALDFIETELLMDFPFVDGASKANFLGLLLTPMVKEFFDGKPPMAIIDSPKGGTGKTLLAKIFSEVTTGRSCELRALPTKETEINKEILSVILASKPYIVFDNVSKTVDSDTLHIAITSETFAGRRLGASENLSLPCDQTFIMTGINIGLTGQLPRRCFWICIDSREVRPYEREGFKKKNIVKWTHENRADIVNALATMVQAWVSAGKPLADIKTTGNFDSWANTVGGILEYAGCQDLMKNVRRKIREEDSEDEEWATFLEIWYEVFFQDNPKYLSEIYEAMKPAGERFLTLLGEATPTEIAEKIEGRSQANFLKSFGITLKRKMNAVYGTGKYEIKKCQTRDKINMWQVVKNDASFPSAISQEDRAEYGLTEDGVDATTRKLMEKTDLEKLN